MAYELRDNSGTLFKNKDRKKDTHPDYQGTVMVNGVEMWINAWVKDGQNGKFFSLAFKEKEQRQSQSSKPSKSFHDDLNDELPPF